LRRLANTSIRSLAKMSTQSLSETNSSGRFAFTERSRSDTIQTTPFSSVIMPSFSATYPVTTTYLPSLRCSNRFRTSRWILAL
jgi:hypothetical protein